ncbi:MAG TPA: PAS domain-containing protein [Rhodothermales bacterium]
MNPTVLVNSSLASRVESVFGDVDDPIELVDARAGATLSEFRMLVWEADAASLECTYIGSTALATLGYPARYWTGRPGFWAKIIHDDDRDETLANCAICAGRARGHNFAYRALAADGTYRHIFNVLRVIRGPRGLAIRLRGILFEVDDPESFASGTHPLLEIQRQEPEMAVED